MNAQGKPLTGTILGAIAGAFVAVVIQQAGAWPLDRMMVFGVMAVMAVIGFLLTKGARGGAAMKVIAIVIMLFLGGMAALGATEAGESGYIEGGCTASASSNLDSISSPAATSKSDPFDIDPAGTLSWDATSPAPILNHNWEIWVDVAGFPYLAANGGDDNEGESQHEAGSEDLSQYTSDIEGILGSTAIGGIYEVSGWIEGEGGACEGMGFVRIPSGWMQGPVSLAATVVALVLVVSIAIVGRRVGPVAIPDLGGSSAPGDAPEAEELFADGFESGDTAAWDDGPAK